MYLYTDNLHKVPVLFTIFCDFKNAFSDDPFTSSVQSSINTNYSSELGELLKLFMPARSFTSHTLA